MALDLKERAPRFIQNLPLWSDFLNAVTTELNIVKTEIAKKASYLDIDAYTDIEELKDTSRAFGYTPILNVAGDDLAYLKEDVKSIVFKIKNKGSLYYYRYIFNLIPYKGKTYALLYDTVDTKLIRTIDIVDMIPYLNAADFTVPFTYAESIIDGYSYNNKFGIDAYIDYLTDQAVTVNRTKHLAMEYNIDQIITSDSVEYLMTDNYLRYLERAVEYGRKASTLPHIGAQLALLIDETGYYDSHNLGETYSVPTLKLASTTTNFYQYTPGVQLYLDESDTLDSAIQWYLDNEQTPSYIKTDANQLYSIFAGVGTKTLPATSETEFYPLTEDLIAYFPFDIETGRAVEDLSSNGWTASIIGSYTYVQSVVNKSIQFNGTDTEIKISPYNISDGDYTYSFWIRGDDASQTGTGPRLYYHSGLLDIFYSTTNQRLYVNLIGSASDIMLSAAITLSSATDNFITVEQSQTTDTVELWINNTLADSSSLTGFGTFESAIDAYIGSSNTGNYFTGLIDDFRIYNKIYTASQRTYLYTYKRGSLAYLNDRIYSQPLADTQRYVDSNWKLVQGWIPARAVNNEYIEEGDGLTQSFSGTLRYGSVRQSYVSISFVDTATTYYITDDGEGLVGTLSGTGVTGTITYATGAYTLTFTSTTPDASTFLLAEYRTDADVQITEIGIADNDDHIVAYATFPPIQFKDMFNHLGVEFAIRKS